MILNKASFERGFAHATVYKSEVSLVRGIIVAYQSLLIFNQLIDLATCGGGRDKNHLIFGKLL